MSTPTRTSKSDRTGSGAFVRARGQAAAALRASSSPIAQAGQLAQFGAAVIWSAIRHPVGYWAEVRDQMFDALKLCWIPMVISTTAFGLGAPGIQAGNFTSLLGVPERLGGFAVLASIREFAPWINAMIVAGVVGTAITADLGARRIREEIDAMQVLGIDPVRALIVPRVVAMTLFTGLSNLVALTFGVVGVYIASVFMFDASTSGFMNQFFANATTTDIWASVLKCSLFGLIVGVVCGFKGYTVGGGPISVGRAVNQAVVIAFAAIWIFNAVFTAVLLGVNPDMLVFK